MDAARHLSALALLLALVGAGCHRTEPAAGPSERPWTQDDFARLAATTGCRALPSFGSPAFARMIEPGLLDSLAPPARPPMERLGALLAYQQALAGIYKRYTMECNDLRSSIAISTVMLEVSSVELQIGDALMAQLPADDPTREARAGGLAKMREGTVAMTSGTALMVRGNAFPAPVPDVGRRLGVALARLERQLPAGALSGALGNLDIPETDDDDANRRALRADIRAGLHASDASP